MSWSYTNTRVIQNNWQVVRETMNTKRNECTFLSNALRFPKHHWFLEGPQALHGPDSSVVIATGYGLDGPGIESRWGRDFPHLFRRVLVPTQPPVQWVPCFSRGKNQPGRDADPSPPSSAVVMKGYSYTSTPPMGRTTCTEPQCLNKGALYLTSVPVQGGTLALPQALLFWPSGIWR